MKYRLQLFCLWLVSDLLMSSVVRAQMDEQNFRNHCRYFVALNYLFNQEALSKESVNLSLYSEVVVNLEWRMCGNGEVDYFDRNPTYTSNRPISSKFLNNKAAAKSEI